MTTELNMLKAFFYRFKWHLALSAILGTLSAMLSVWVISLITDVIGELEGGGGVDLSVTQFVQFIFVVVGVFCLGFLSQFVVMKLSANVVYELRVHMLKRVLATGYRQIEKIGGHRVMATLTEDIGRFSTGFMILPELFFNTVTVLLCIAYLLYLSWALTAVTLVVVGVLGGLSVLAIRYADRHQVALRELDDSMFSNLRALTNGGKEINVNKNRMRFFYFQLMSPLFKNIRKHTIKSSVVFISMGSVSNALILLLIGSIVFASSMFGLTEVKTIVAFIFVVLYLMDPLLQNIDMISQLNETKISLNKVGSLELADVEQFSLSAHAKCNRIEVSSLGLSDATYTYHYAAENGDEHAFELGPVSMQANKGELIFVTGGNGSGKSTFAKLLVGLYKPDAGSVMIDGRAITGEQDAAPSLDNTTVIFSDFFLFDQVLDSTGELADDGEIDRLLHLLQLEHKVTPTNGVLSTTNLSHGQQKRLAMVQALIEDAQICVFDEWAANQDAEFKSYFYHTLLQELKAKGKIVIVISHDENYFDVADRRLHFSEGKLVNC